MRSTVLARSVIVLGLLLAGGPNACAQHRPTSPDEPSRLCEYGIALAISGRESAAESAFVALLSYAPRDARALNNLGNLKLRNGDPELALAFYRRAGEVDTADAGIELNAAVTLALLGDEAAALAVAGDALPRAGGLSGAAALLGLSLRDAADSTSRAAGRATMSRARALELLRAAVNSVPPDSSRSSAPGTDSTAAGRYRALPWRSAGARGADSGQLPAIVYWKRS